MVKKADLLVGVHGGYQRLTKPVLHRRAIYFDKERSLWIIRDTFEGEGEHQLNWYFHLAPDLRAERMDSPSAILIRDQAAPHTLLIVPISRDFEPQVELAEVSCSYGRRFQSSTVHYSKTPVLPITVTFAISYAPGGHTATICSDLIGLVIDLESCFNIEA